MPDPSLLTLDFVIPNQTPINKIAVANQPFQEPVLQDTSNYIVSITKFTADAFFPLFYPTIPDPAQPLQTDMSLTFTYTGTPFFQAISVSLEEVKNGVTSIGVFLQDVNAASLTAFTALKLAFPAAPGQIAPYFAFNPDTQIISMYVDSGWLDTVAPPNNIYFNQQLQSLLNLPYTRYTAPPNPNGLDYLIAVKDYSKLLPAAGSRSTYPYAIRALAFDILQVEQEFSQPFNFSDINKIIFTSAQLPVVPELLPNPQSPGQTSTVSNSVMSIITDLSLGNDFDRSGFIEYLPTAEYRRIALLPGKPIDAIDIQVYYTTYNGNIFPLLIKPGGSVTIKFLFEKQFR